MRGSTFLCAALAALLVFGQADACSRRRTTTRNDGTGTVVIAPRNPLMTPPTPAPTPPPPPPPLESGWVPPPPGPPANMMSRSNCDVDIQFVAPATNGTISRVQVTEKWVYTCRFSVYVEVEVSNITSETPCACAMAWQPVRVDSDVNFQRSFETQITTPLMVVYDARRNVLVEPFPSGQFDSFARNPNTTAAIVQQLSDSQMDYSPIVEGFSAIVRSTNPLPASLIPGNAKYNPNNVPALCFNVEEKYISDYKWPEPPFPLMYTTPNVWITPCVGLSPPNELPAQAKRQAGAVVDVGSKYQRFFREFLLFPVTVATGGSNTPARYMTAYYNSSNCISATGLATLDREFSFTISRERKFNLHGAFQWTRSFGDAFMVGGVPSGFSDSVEFWSDLYTKVSWTEPISKPNGASHGAPRVDANGVYTLHSFLLGKQPAATAGDEFANFGTKNQMCTNVPAGWEKCTSDCFKTDSEFTQAYRKEGALKFKLPANYTGFDCRPYFQVCAQDSTTLSFQNFGDLARDFSKRRDSFLLTGPRSQFCTNGPSRALWDALYFVPYRSSIRLRKRDGFGVSEDAPAQLVGTNGFITNNQLMGEQEFSAVGQANAGFAAGQADANGLPAGDHPLKLFSEVYSLPISLHPDDTSYDGQYGSIWNMLAPPCLEGSMGCSCRELSARSPCDGLLKCNEKRFCERPLCPEGEPGCLCAANSQCNKNNYQCNSRNVCVFRVGCQAGEAGCPCSTGACASANATCIPCDSVDSGKSDEDLTEVRKDASCFSTCAFLSEEISNHGKTGYACTASGKCSNAIDECDPYLNVCKPPTCTPGSAGCLCAVGSRCAVNFECDTSAASSLDHRCEVRRCPAGTAGCPCIAPNNTCNGGYACLPVDNANTEFRCVQKARVCTNDRDRCKKYCGDRPIQSCPACSDQLIRCFETAGASAVVPSIALLVAVVLALLF